MIGAGLSPNGIGLDGEGMVSLALMDKVLSVDRSKQQVTVQVRARFPYFCARSAMLETHARGVGAACRLASL